MCFFTLEESASTHFIWKYLQFLPPNNVHCINAPFLKNLFTQQIFIAGPLCWKYCACLGRIDIYTQGLCPLKSLQSYQRGKRKDKSNWGAICIQTLRSANSGKFNNGAPKLIVNNFPAPKTLCPCWAWINDFSTKYWIRRNSFMVYMGYKKNGSAIRMSGPNSEKLWAFSLQSRSEFSFSWFLDLEDMD